MTERHEYHNTVHSRMQPRSHLGHDLHLCTSNAFGSRMLNLRLFRVMPSKTGHSGYTRIGFFLTRNEARELRDLLTDVIENEGAWDIIESEPLRDIPEDDG